MSEGSLTCKDCDRPAERVLVGFNGWRAPFCRRHAEQREFVGPWKPVDDEPAETAMSAVMEGAR
jgi:hypothetical protein